MGVMACKQVSLAKINACDFELSREMGFEINDSE